MINLQDCLINYRLLPSALSRRSSSLINMNKNYLSHFYSTGELPHDYKKIMKRHQNHSLKEKNLYSIVIY